MTKEETLLVINTIQEVVDGANEEWARQKFDGHVGLGGMFAGNPLNSLTSDGKLEYTEPKEVGKMIAQKLLD